MNKFQYAHWAVKGLVATQALARSGSFFLPQVRPVATCISVAEPTLRYGVNKLWQSELNQNLTANQASLVTKKVGLSGWEAVDTDTDSALNPAYLPQKISWKTVWNDGVNSLNKQIDDIKKNPLRLISDGLRLAENAFARPITFDDWNHLKNIKDGASLFGFLNSERGKNLRIAASIKLYSFVLDKFQESDEAIAREEQLKKQHLLRKSKQRNGERKKSQEVTKLVA